MPRVSVVIPTYNRADYIADAIDSALRQTFTDFEIIVVDDGSTDNTREIVNEYTDRRVKYIYQENSGVSVARNTGIKSSDSEYIAFLDSDDIYLEDMLEKSVRVLDEYPEVGYSYGQSKKIIVGENTYRIRASPYHRHSTVLDPVEQVRELCFDCHITTSTYVARRHCLEEIGGYHPELWLGEDYHLFVRMAKKYTGYYIAELLIVTRMHVQQLHKTNKPGREKAFLLILQEIFEDPDFAPQCEDIKGKTYSFFYRRWLLGSAYDYYRDMKLTRQYLRKAVKYYPGIILTPQIFVIIYKYIASLLPNRVRLVLLGIKRKIYYPLEKRE